MVTFAATLAFLSMPVSPRPANQVVFSMLSVTLSREAMTFGELADKHLAPWVLREKGLRLEVGKPFRNRKVTVMVEYLPLDWLLESIADALYGRWEKRKDRLVFEVTSPERTLLEKLKAEDEGIYQAELDGVFVGCKRLVDAAQGQRVTPTNAVLQQSLSGLRKSNPLEYVRVDSMLLMSSESEPVGASGGDGSQDLEPNPIWLSRVILGTLTETERKQMLADGSCWGTNLSDSLSSKSRFRMLSKSLPKGYTWTLRPNAQRSKITVSLLSNGKDAAPKLLPQVEYGGSWAEGDEALGAVETWQSQVAKWRAGSTIPPELQRPIELDGAALTESADGPKPLSRVLSQISQKAKLNIVAELGWERIPRRPRPKLGPTKEALAMYFQPQNFAYRFRNSCLVIRTRFSHRMEQEPSVAILSKIEEAELKDGSGLLEAGRLLTFREFSLLPTLAVSVTSLNKPAAFEAFRVLGRLNLKPEKSVIGFASLPPELQRSVVAMAIESTRGSLGDRMKLMTWLQSPNSVAMVHESGQLALTLSKTDNALKQDEEGMPLKIWSSAR